MNALQISQKKLNILQSDHEALLEKYRKLSLNTQTLVDKVNIAKKEQKISGNKATKAESLLKTANLTISADTDELRNRMEKATEKKQDDIDKDNERLYQIINNNSKSFQILKNEEERLRLELEKSLLTFKGKETTITTLENSYSSIVSDYEKKIKGIKFNIKASVKNLESAKKYKGDNSKLTKEILDYKGKIMRDSKIIEQLKSELGVTKKNMKDISERYADNNKDYLDYKRKAEDLEGKLMLVSDQATRLEKEAKRIIPESAQITILENKYGYLVGKVVSAKNRITSLNTSTPYRPGAVERTLSDVLGDLKNV